MYYLMEPKYGDETITIDESSHYDYSLTLGEKMPDDFPEPMLFEVDIEIGGSVAPTTFLPQPVFTNEFVEALQKAGVDNLDTYEVEIAYPDSSERIEGYLAVNIVGRVSCADLGASDYVEIGETHIIRKLTIDPTRIAGLLMFRLFEYGQMILVSEKVVERIGAEQFPDVQFTPIGESSTPEYSSYYATSGRPGGRRSCLRISRRRSTS